jgi:hypothetical protein
VLVPGQEGPKFDLMLALKLQHSNQIQVLVDLLAATLLNFDEFAITSQPTTLAENNLSECGLIYLIPLSEVCLHAQERLVFPESVKQGTSHRVYKTLSRAFVLGALIG